MGGGSGGWQCLVASSKSLFIPLKVPMTYHFVRLGGRNPGELWSKFSPFSIHSCRNYFNEEIVYISLYLLVSLDRQVKQFQKAVCLRSPLSISPDLICLRDACT